MAAHNSHVVKNEIETKMARMVLREAQSQWDHARDMLECDIENGVALDHPSRIQRAFTARLWDGRVGEARAHIDRLEAAHERLTEDWGDLVSN